MNLSHFFQPIIIVLVGLLLLDGSEGQGNETTTNVEVVTTASTQSANMTEATGMDQTGTGRGNATHSPDSRVTTEADRNGGGTTAEGVTGGMMRTDGEMRTEEEMRTDGEQTGTGMPPVQQTTMPPAKETTTAGGEMVLPTFMMLYVSLAMLYQVNIN